MQEVERLYRAYRDEIYRYLCSLTHDPALAEDLLSETFLKALQGLSRFSGGASVKTWLCSIARHAWIDELRRRKPTLSYDDLLTEYLADEAAAPEAFEAQLDTKALAQRVRQLLDTRKPPAGRIVLLRARGYSFAEIAQKCGISESSARTLDFRTRHWLREIMQKEEQP